MQASIPVKAYEHTCREVAARRELKSIVYPESQIVLQNTSADKGANVIYLYFKAMKDAPFDAKIVRFCEPACGKVCATCEHYDAHFRQISPLECRMISAKEGRCRRVRIPGKRTNENDTCEHWKERE